MGRQRRLHQTYIEGRSPGALEHIWYPTAVRIKRGALLNSLAGSVIMADRRGADREKYPGAVCFNVLK